MAANMLLSSGVRRGEDTLNCCFLPRLLPTLSSRSSAFRLSTTSDRLSWIAVGSSSTRSGVAMTATRAVHDDRSSKNFAKTGGLPTTKNPAGLGKPVLMPPPVRRVSTDVLKNHRGLTAEQQLAGIRLASEALLAPVVKPVVPETQSSRPDWWPEAGTNYIDLSIHDLPHDLATLEWWYVNSHFSTADGRQFSIFASFFRLAETDDSTGEILRHCHSVTWALTDVSKKTYSTHTLLDPHTPKKALELLKGCKEGDMDPLVHRALTEVYSKGVVPLPDCLLQEDAHVSSSRLELDYEGNRFEKTSDGRYRLTLLSHDGTMGAELTFDPKTPPIRHGDGGVVSSGPKDEGMFYYFMPNCGVQGNILVDGNLERIQNASGWYDHEFGRPNSESMLRKGMAWNWLSAQLTNGYQITAYNLFDVDDTSVVTGRCVVLIDPAGEYRVYKDFVLQPVEDSEWTSMRTFVEYPVAWELKIPSANISLRGEAIDLPTQEYVTSLSNPAFWEGRINVTGVFTDGKWVSGLGYVERAGFAKLGRLKDFFKAVTRETLKAVHRLLPLPLTKEDLVRLIGIKSRPNTISGVDCEQFASSVIKPIRDVIDRSGKCWRSYASIASADVIGRTIDHTPDNLAYAELMHVGSLIIDDVQDRSTLRRGHPTCHTIYGQPLAINAGSICYFLAQLVGKEVEGRDAEKLQVYDLFFETMRAAHAGQALDIDGFESLMPAVVEKGASVALELEERVLTVHLLKSGAPCASLGRGGAQKGGGTPEQIEAVGNFYECIGLAFQIVDDVLNLRGFEGNLKQRGEDIACGKITMPIAKAMSRLPRAGRQSLWDVVRSKPTDQEVISSAIQQLEECGALQACADQATEVVESAWRQLDPLVPDSSTKILLRAFGWYVLHRHY